MKKDADVKWSHNSDVFKLRFNATDGRTLRRAAKRRRRKEAKKQPSAGNGGQLTMNFLSSLRTQMVNYKVPPLDDGCFILFCTSDFFAFKDN